MASFSGIRAAKPPRPPIASISKAFAAAAVLRLAADGRVDLAERAKQIRAPPEGRPRRGRRRPSGQRAHPPPGPEGRVDGRDLQSRGD